ARFTRRLRSANCSSRMGLFFFTSHKSPVTAKGPEPSRRPLGRKEGHGTKGGTDCSRKRAPSHSGQERSAAASPDRQSSGGFVRRQERPHHPLGKHQAVERYSALAHSAEHALTCERGR